MPHKGYKQTEEHKKKISKSMKGKIPIHHFEIGDHHKEETKRKISNKQKGRKHTPQEGFQKGHKISKGDKNAMWKGKDASCTAIHIWVKKWNGKPKICEFCGKPAKHWANIDHKYRRILSDYIALCVSCHRKYDCKYNSYKLFGRENNY